MKKGEQKKRGQKESGRDFLAGGGELGALIRAYDWTRTPLGPPARWPQSLKTAVRIMLTSRQPFWIGYGPELTYLYNDPYKSIIGGKHPAALGRPFSEVWKEIWDVVGPMSDHVVGRDEGTYVESQLLIMERFGYPEETYYTFSYSPIPGEDGRPGGLICANTDDTRRVIGERQIATLRELSARTANARTWQDACALGAQALAINSRDLPFAVIYMEGSLAAATGIDPERAPEPPQTSEFRTIALDASSARLPTGAWQRAPAQAALVPIAASGSTGRSGVLLAALNPFRKLDESYRGFLELVAAQIASAIANAQAYEEERKRAEALAELDRAKTVFFSNVSHELRTPLTLILGPVEDGLADGEAPLPPAQRERLELARRNGLRLQKLVNSLLDFSRIEAGRAQASYLPTQLGALTTDLASSFRSAVEKAGLKLIVDCPQLPDLSYVDRDMWEKIVLNLLSNAFKFTLEGEIAVTLRQVESHVELAVRDTGVGISAAELPRLFERFHRIEGVRSRTHEGTGIGLALVKELVKLHGGSIEVASAPGAGTTFTVSIPRGRSHLPAAAIGTEHGAASTALRAEAFVEEALRWLPDTPAAAGNGAAGRRRILVADDNADLREYVHRLLGGEYHVQTAPHGEAALAAARAHRPDLVVTDAMMPGLDGFGLIRELRADPGLRTVPVIVLSARAGEEARLEGLGKGADDYLVKPFSARELLVRVGAMLQSMDMRRDVEEALREREAQLNAELVDARLLQEISTELVREDNVEVIYGKIMDAAVAIMRSDFASMQKYYPERGARGELRLLAFRGFDPEAARFWEWVRADSDCTCGAVLRTGDRVIAADVEKCDFMAGSADQAALLKAGIHAAQSTPLRSRDGKLVGMISTHWKRAHQPSARDLRLLDILARQAADLIERAAASDALKEADRRKDEFLAMLSHELRNPLAPIRNAVSLLQEADGEAPVREQARAILDRQVGQLTRLVDDLLDIARISRGSISLKKEIARLDEIVADAVETSRPLIEEGSHRLDLELPEGPIWLSADRIRLTQVIANLLNNAARYTPNGGRISLTARADAGAAAITVRDNGIGIDPQQLPGVFDMFFQAGNGRQLASGGLGVGLALARQLVELHGGSIEARSEGIGRGSEFTICVPLPILPAVAREAARRPAPDSGRRVLIAEDNTDAAQSLGMLLRKMGHAVRLSYDGAAALEDALREPPEIVLLDIDMPKLDGYAVASRLREDRRFDRVPIVALTGLGQDLDRRRSRQAGFDHHVLKPVDISALREALELIRSNEQHGAAPGMGAAPSLRSTSALHDG